MGNERKARPTLSSMHRSMASSGKPAMTMKGDDAAGSTDAGEPGVGEHSELHPHDDGTAHTITSDGEKTEHPSIHHALVHMAAHHGPGEKHMMVHHMGGLVVTTHHAGADGEVQGPHEHDANNLEGLKDHMDRFLNEEEREGDWGGGEGKAEPAMSGGGEEMY
jgi:hypothetical protein